MQQWEYRTEVVSRFLVAGQLSLDAALENAGTDGRELIGFSMESWNGNGYGSVGDWRLVFKRPKE